MSAAEAALLQEGNITVTPTRFMVSGETFAIRNITSVRLQAEHNMAAAVAAGVTILSVVGSCWIGSITNAQFGFILFAAGIIAAFVLLFKIGPSSWQVVIATAGGERPAFVTRDMGFAVRIAEALNQAITRQG